ncbi:hypothetical protein GJV11_19175 [Enterobacteriaceae bacterium RIT693]|nr:hypothetical protein [Enterobacteriaceae bacterium RIT693]
MLAHALWGAIGAELAGGNALAGGAGAVTGELAAGAIVNALYPGRSPESLTESEKQTVSALSSLAAGLAGGLSGGSVADAVTAAQAGKNAVENNFFLLHLLTTPPPVAGQTGAQAEANALIAQKLDVAVKEFGKGVVEQCLSGGDCPVAAYIMLQTITAMMSDNADSKPNLGGGLTDEEKAELGGAGSGTPQPPENDQNGHNKEKPSNIKMADDKYLKKNGIDAHELKSEIVGKKNISKYDIYIDKETGELWIFRKGGTGEGIPTGEFIK